MDGIRFTDRRDAGHQLGLALATLGLRQPVVLALPRGGVPVAFEVARALQAPLGVILVRKLGAPFSREFAIGAVAWTNRFHTLLDEAVLGRLRRNSDALDAYIEEQVDHLQVELERRRRLYADAGGALSPQLEGRTVVVVDDGIATGNTMRAALMAATEEKPKRLMFAAPVGSADMVQALQASAEGLVLHVQTDFRAVSLYYANFEQTADDEVVALLAAARSARNNNPKELHMQKISDVMTRDVKVVGPGDTLQKAAQIMNEMDVGSLPVCDGTTLLGMITDRDITVRAVAQGKGPNDMKVAEVMSEGVSYCFEDQDVQEVLQQMGDEQIRRMPVLDRNKQLVGVVALGDIAVRDDVHTDSALEGISQPAQPAQAAQGRQSQRPSP